jgi:branched-chain amino acid transport system substrate-binding protein
MIRGTFDSTRPALQGELDDGTSYRLWQVRGDFRNDFDLRRYPFDRQTLTVEFFHARADADRIVYVQDKRSVRGALSGLSASQTASPTEASFDRSPLAFRHLTQWEPIRTSQRRANLLTQSALGDPRLVGFERMRELSGFSFTAELKRRVLANLTKTLLPLLLMALILYASMHFPTTLAGTRSGIAVTCALAGTVLLSSINSQLGNVGYVIAVEFGFYGFFALCLLCIVALLLIERYRLAEQKESIAAVERISKRLFLAGLGAILLAAGLTYVQS